jgi:hypothetical protein
MALIPHIVVGLQPGRSCVAESEFSHDAACEWDDRKLLWDLCQNWT